MKVEKLFLSRGSCPQLYLCATETYAPTILVSPLFEKHVSKGATTSTSKNHTKTAVGLRRSKTFHIDNIS